MTKDEKYERGLRAARLLDDADIREAFALVKTELFVEWEDAKDEKARESLHAVNRGLSRILATLERWRVDAVVIQRERENK